MVDFFINSYQVNDANYDIVITDTKVSSGVNTASHSIPRKADTVKYATSGEDEQLDISFTIRRTTGGDWLDLKRKQRDIRNLVYGQVAGAPLLLRVVATGGEDDKPIYLDYNGVYVFIEDGDFPTVGTNGKNLLDIKLSGKVVGVPISEGGSFVLSDYYSVIST